jgi:hypothetical protein
MTQSRYEARQKQAAVRAAERPNCDVAIGLLWRTTQFA